MENHHKKPWKITIKKPWRNHHNQKVNHVNQPFYQMTISQISHQPCHGESRGY